MKKFDLSFDFRSCHYEAAIRVRQEVGGTEFVVTVLNWDLERLLYGNHIIRKVEGALQANVLEEKRDQTELKLIIAARLSEYLKIPAFVGEQCLLASTQADSWETFHPLPRHEHVPQEISVY